MKLILICVGLVTSSLLFQSLLRDYKLKLDGQNKTLNINNSKEDGRLKDPNDDFSANKDA